MNINIILGHALPFPPIKGGGIERINYALSKALVKLGNSVTVYSRMYPGLETNEIDEFGIDHIRLKGYDFSKSKIINAVNSFIWCVRIAFVIKKADVTIFNSLFSFLMSKWKKLGIIANSVQRTPDWKLFFFNFFDRNYCTCNSVLKQAESLPFKLKNLIVLYNCIELPSIKVENIANQNHGLRFLYFGRIISDKGLEYLIKGFREALQRHPENELIILGPKRAEEGSDPSFFNMLKSYVNTNGLNDKIKFFPPIYEKNLLENVIVESDALCFPSISGEGFPSAVLEAMALYKPVLVSDFGPMTEAVVHLESGYITKLKNIQSISDGINYFSENKHLLHELGCNARERVEKYFSSEVIANELIQDINYLNSTKNPSLRND